MSLITTCPSCGTRFRVVADQLRISEGWVRCGQCQDVFDAHQHLDAAPAHPAQPTELPEPTVPAVSMALEPSAASPTEPAAALPAPPPVAEVSAPVPGYELPVPAWQEDDDGAHDPSLAPADAVLRHEDQETIGSTSRHGVVPTWDDSRLPGAGDMPEQPVAASEAAQPGQEPGAMWAGSAAMPADMPEVDARAEALTTAAAIESVAQKLAQAETDAAGGGPPAMSPLVAQDMEAELEGMDPALEPGFVRAARRQAWWQKPLVRVAMGAAVVVLPVALVLQVALHERNALVAWQPGLRPALEFMCTALQCKLGPRQQIAALVVSGSAFTKTDAERSYTLSLSIQNQSRTPVGMPALELTLTDAQDQAIARKVITVKELTAPHELRAGAEWSVVLPITTPGLNLPVAGYRVLLFYP